MVCNILPVAMFFKCYFLQSHPDTNICQINQAYHILSPPTPYAMESSVKGRSKALRLIRIRWVKHWIFQVLSYIFKVNFFLKLSRLPPPTSYAMESSVKGHSMALRLIKIRWVKHWIFQVLCYPQFKVNFCLNLSRSPPQPHMQWKAL